MENKLADLFALWGYQEVLTPTFEYYKSLTDRDSGLNEDMLYKFIDRNGKVLSLRPDMTTPIARMVSSRMREAALPLRLFYLANVFRYEKTHAGRQREFFQAGVELMGASGPKADAEVLGMAIFALEELGVKNFRIGIGQVEVTKALLGTLDQAVGFAVKQAIARKDFVELEALLTDKLPVKERDVLMEMAMSRGDIKDLEQLMNLVGNTKARDALSDLVEVFRILDYQGLSQKVFFDLGIFRDLNYYTGIVFEGYVQELGFPICGGGRYDNLLEGFGYPLPATGFALGIERIMLASKQPKEDASKGYFLAGDYPNILDKAQSLRAQGQVVRVALESLTKEQAEEQATAQGMSLIYGGDNVE